MKSALWSIPCISDCLWSFGPVISGCQLSNSVFLHLIPLPHHSSSSSLFLIFPAQVHLHLTFSNSFLLCFYTLNSISLISSLFSLVSRIKVGWGLTTPGLGEDNFLLPLSQTVHSLCLETSLFSSLFQLPFLFT